MFLILIRFINSIVFVIANASIGGYTLQRFFRAMRTHYQLMDEVKEFSSLVAQSRSSLDFVGSKVIEAMKEMELDIGKEVYVTHNLTKLNAEVGVVAKRFKELEEGIIELARLSHNMENATVETPADINEEVRSILIALKRSKSPSCSEAPFEAHNKRKAGVNRAVRSHGAVEPPQTSAPTSPKPVRAHAVRPRSPIVVPEVMLLDEQSRDNMDKPIGFRPPWMCQV